MLSFFRRVSNSKIGTGFTAVVLIGILAGFAMSDIQNFGSGNIGFGMSSSTLAEVGDQSIKEREVSEAMQRRLQDARKTRPEADYATIAGDFETILSSLIDEKTLLAFADKYGFNLSKRLVDAEIAQIPATRGLNGKFSDAAYQQFLSRERLSDDQVREILASSLIQRLILTPITANARISVGMATPYAAMMLESREGEAAAIPVAAFTAGLKPTDAQLQTYYAANRARYMVPEQRTLRVARIDMQNVSSVAPTDQEIAAYYNANKAAYAAKDFRTISQAVVPDQATANAIANRAKAGGTLAAAAAPAGNNAAVTSLAHQSREDYAGVAGDKAAAAVFGAASGAVVGPVQSDFGWVVAKVESIQTEGGQSLDQVRGAIAAKLVLDKRKQAIEDIADKVQTAVDNGANFTEAVAAAKLSVTTTPLVTAAGTAPGDPSYKLPPALSEAAKAGFEIAPNDPPEIVALKGEDGYVVVSPGEVEPAAPAPLAKIRERVQNDWVLQQATVRAKTVASAIQAKVARGMSLAQAVKESGAPLAVRPLKARRIEIAMAEEPAPLVVQSLFTVLQGKSKLVTDKQGRGFFVVKVDKIVPGNPLLQPALITRMQNELQESVSDDYAREFMAALRKDMKLERNEKAIDATKKRILSSGG
jgi:peptidyl-prolyl cis-trans isomerase D